MRFQECHASLLARESCYGVFGRREARGTLRGGRIHGDTVQRLRASKRILIYLFVHLFIYLSIYLSAPEQIEA
jgi:hypothetical protein